MFQIALTDQGQLLRRSIEIKSPQSDQKEEGCETQQNSDLRPNVSQSKPAQHQLTQSPVRPILGDNFNNWTKELVENEDGDKGAAEDSQPPNQQAAQSTDLILGAGKGCQEDTEGSGAQTDNQPDQHHSQGLITERGSIQTEEAQAKDSKGENDCELDHPNQDIGQHLAR